jgi:hypothetical protein
MERKRLPEGHVKVTLTIFQAAVLRRKKMQAKAAADRKAKIEADRKGRQKPEMVVKNLGYVRPTGAGKSAFIYNYGAMPKVIPDQAIEIKTSRRLYRALLAISPGDKDWGVVKAFTYNRGTPQSMIEEHDHELRNAMQGWSLSSVFAPGTKFKIATVPAPDTNRVY